MFSFVCYLLFSSSRARRARRGEVSKTRFDEGQSTSSAARARGLVGTWRVYRSTRAVQRHWFTPFFYQRRESIVPYISLMYLQMLNDIVSSTGWRQANLPSQRRAV
jgi:hypothetical protein